MASLKIITNIKFTGSDYTVITDELTSEVVGNNWTTNEFQLLSKETTSLEIDDTFADVPINVWKENLSFLHIQISDTNEENLTKNDVKLVININDTITLTIAQLTLVNLDLDEITSLTIEEVLFPTPVDGEDARTFNLIIIKGLN